MALRHLLFLSAAFFALPGYAATLHQYDLNGSLADSLGGPSSVANGGTLGATGYTFDFAQGLSLSNPGVSNVCTIELVLRLDAVCLTKWCKLIDFKNLSGDDGFYNDPSNQLHFWVGGTAANGATTLGTGNRKVRLSLTAYLDGVQQFSFLDTSGAAVFSAANIAWFLQDEGDQGNPGEYGRGFPNPTARCLV